MFVKMIYLKSLLAVHNTGENNQHIVSSYMGIQITGHLFGNSLECPLKNVSDEMCPHFCPQKMSCRLNIFNENVV